MHYIPLGKYERITTDLYLPYVDPFAAPDRYSLAAPPEHRLWFQQVYGPYASPWFGWLAVVVVALLTLVVYLMVFVAYRALQEESQ